MREPRYRSGGRWRISNIFQWRFRGFSSFKSAFKTVVIIKHNFSSATHDSLNRIVKLATCQLQSLDKDQEAGGGFRTFSNEDLVDFHSLSFISEPHHLHRLLLQQGVTQILDLIFSHSLQKAENKEVLRLCEYVKNFFFQRKKDQKKCITGGFGLPHSLVFFCKT